MPPLASLRVPLLSIVLWLGGVACAGLGSQSSVTELRPGRMLAGSTTETQGSISVTHIWSVELTDKDAVFTFDDRRLILEDVVGKKPLRCTGNESTGKSPDVVLELADGRSARWKGLSIDVDGRFYEISGPGTFVIDANGTMKRRGG